MQFLNPAGISASQDCTIQEATEKLKEVAQWNSQTWNDIQWTSGGQINLGKCYYYSFRHKVNYKTNKTQCLNAPLSSPITISPKKIWTHTLANVDSSEGRHTLGAIIALDSDGRHQLHVSLLKAKELRGKLVNAGLSQMAQWLAVTMVVEPAITYPMVTCTFPLKIFIQLTPY